MRGLFGRKAIVNMLLALAIVVSVFSRGIVAHATFNEDTKWDETEIETWITNNVDETDGTCELNSINNLIEKGAGGTDDIQIGAGLYHIKKDDIPKVRAALKSKYKNDSAYNKVEDITTGVNVKADTAGAAAIMAGFQPIVSLVLGLLLWAVFVGMTVFTALDISYIAFPVFRNKCQDMKQEGGIGTKKTSNGDRKLTFITDDAEYALATCTVESGKSPYGAYLKRRSVSFILLGIVIFILMTNNIDLLVNIVLRLVSGIMNVLSSLAS